MSRSNWLYYLAFGLSLFLAPALHAQGTSGSEPGAVSEDGDARTKNGNSGPEEKSKPADTSPADTETAINSPVSGPATDIIPEERNGYPNCEFDSVPECDLAAQQSMAESTFWMMVAAGAGVVLTVIGVFLLWRTLLYTRQAAKHTERAVKAANDSVLEARRQADAMIRLEAAKFIVKSVLLHPEKGGPHQTKGIPENGRVIRARLQNIGNTPAFPLRSCLLWKVREAPPEIRLPISAVHHYPPGKIVDTGEDISIQNAFGTISLSEESIAAIQIGHATLWAYGSITYKDWFGIERTEEFILRWKGSLEPDENRNTTHLGFVPHGKAE